MNFNQQEVEVIRGMVEAYLDEGYQVPPYSDIEYTVFEKLGAKSFVYDSKRPEADQARGQS